MKKSWGVALVAFALGLSFSAGAWSQSGRTWSSTWRLTNVEYLSLVVGDYSNSDGNWSLSATAVTGPSPGVAVVRITADYSGSEARKLVHVRADAIRESARAVASFLGLKVRFEENIKPG